MLLQFFVVSLVENLMVPRLWQPSSISPVPLVLITEVLIFIMSVVVCFRQVHKRVTTQSVTWRDWLKLALLRIWCQGEDSRTLYTFLLIAFVIGRTHSNVRLIMFPGALGQILLWKRKVGGNWDFIMKSKFVHKWVLKIVSCVTFNARDDLHIGVLVPHSRTSNTKTHWSVPTLPCHAASFGSFVSRCSGCLDGKVKSAASSKRTRQLLQENPVFLVGWGITSTFLVKLLFSWTHASLAASLKTRCRILCGENELACSRKKIWISCTSQSFLWKF